MDKKILVFAILTSVFFGINKAEALIVFPYFNINVNEHSVGGDGSFTFHVTAEDLPDPSYPVEDFSVDTVDGSGSYTTGGSSSNATIFILTQDQQTGWGNPTIVCTSIDPLVTSSIQDKDSITIHSRAYSSIDCDVTNTKISDSKTPVLIIPGVMGTDIYNNSNKLWLNVTNNITDVGDQFMDDLQFNSNLIPVVPTLSTGNVVSKIPSLLGFGGFDYTGSLIQEFENQGYTQGSDSTDNLFLFPYDWRYGVSDDTIAKLKQKIADIKTQTGSDKVDVIAHSTGGLLVKKYVMENPDDNYIDKAVFVGVPNTGAPKAIKVLLQGDNFGNPFLADSEMKKIAANLPVVYDLSPSRQYFNQKGSYVETIDQSLFINTGSAELTFDQVDDFLSGDHGLNLQALTNAHNLHTPSFDNFDLRSAGVDLYAIDGCKTGTMGKIIERRRKDIFGSTLISYDKPEEVVGDGTVPLESATNLPIDTDHKYYALKADHGKMPSQNGIRQQIVNLISGSSLDVSNSDITQDISKCKLNGKAISIYSPLSVDITDQNGNHAGIATDESIHNDIPNADFEMMGDHKFVYLPTDEGQIYSIKTRGTGDGTFTLKNENIADNESTGTEVFSNIPVTTSLTGTLSLGTTTSMSLDTDGDGVTDSTITPSSVVDSNQSKDLIPPVTTPTVEGLSGQSGFYRSSVDVSLLATDPTVDDNPSQTSGVLKINYALDDGGYKEYSGVPINITTEGQHTLKFFATDKAGNNETEQLLSFTIDKTAPEMIIQFDPISKDLRFNGIDNVSKEPDLTTIDQDDTIAVTDQAGNVTIMELKDKDRKHKFQTSIKSLSYNGQFADISKNIFSFDWKLNNKTHTLSRLHQHIKSKKDFNIDALYHDGSTTLLGKDQNGILKKTLDGLVPLQITTNQGDFNWSY